MLQDEVGAQNYMESIIPFSFSSTSEPALSLVYVGSNQCQSCGGQENAKLKYNGVCLDSRLHKFGIVSQAWVVNLQNKKNDYLKQKLSNQNHLMDFNPLNQLWLVFIIHMTKNCICLRRKTWVSIINLLGNDPK